MFRTKSLKKALLFLGSLLLSSAAFGDSSLRSIRIQFPGSTSLDSAVAIDILFVREQAIADQLPFEQFAWFSGKQAIIARYAQSMTVVGSELLPGEAIDLELPMDAAESAAVLVYASHEDPVAESIDITQEKNILLLVEDWGIDVQQKN